MLKPVWNLDLFLKDLLEFVNFSLKHSYQIEKEYVVCLLTMFATEGMQTSSFSKTSVCHLNRGITKVYLKIQVLHPISYWMQTFRLVHLLSRFDPILEICGVLSG